MEIELQFKRFFRIVTLDKEFYGNLITIQKFLLRNRHFGQRVLYKLGYNLKIFLHRHIFHFLSLFITFITFYHLLVTFNNLFITLITF